MEKVIKNIIDEIVNSELEDTRTFHEIVTPIIFKKNKLGLFVDYENHCCEFLIPTKSDEKKCISKLRLLTKLFSLFRQFQDEHAIYLKPLETYESSNLYYEGKSSYDIGQSDNRIIIAYPSTLLKKESDGTHSIYEDGKKILKGVKGGDFLIDDIQYYFNSVMFATFELENYVRRNYKTEGRFCADNANSISKRSIIVSVIICVISPFLSTCISNKHGTSTLCKSQFDSIVDIIVEKNNSVLPNMSHDSLEKSTQLLILKNVNHGEYKEGSN